MDWMIRRCSIFLKEPVHDASEAGKHLTFSFAPAISGFSFIGHAQLVKQIAFIASYKIFIQTIVNAAAAILA